MAKVLTSDVTSAQKSCEPCTYKKQTSVAVCFCKDCDEYLCSDCKEVHASFKATRAHILIESRGIDKHQSAGAVARNETNYDTHYKQNRKHELETVHKNPLPKNIPGKPIFSGIKANSLMILWEACSSFSKKDHYQIRYKEVIANGRWKYHPKEHVTTSSEITDLKAKTQYVFQVRVIHDNDSEWPYGEQSEIVTTASSPASDILKLSSIVVDGNPCKLALPIRENVHARNEKAKSKKFEIGTSPKNYTDEKTIMLVGATGTGKSTLVDGMVNYLLGVNWHDTFRFTIINLEKDEADRLHNQAVSQTEWITVYRINPHPGSRIGLTLNIIDTPGFGDTRGIQRDHQIIEQIRQLFSEPNARGVAFIDAVCFLIKAPDSRLTATQIYIFESIMGLFGKDIKPNICSLITFADGVEPPVISALTASKLPFGKHFEFNNSGLFAKNVDLDSSNLSQMFWDMGCASFKAFFEHIKQMETKSLQMSKDVLEERHKLEITVQTLQPTVSKGLSKLDEIKTEMNVFQQNKTEIEDNKDFRYTVTEIHQDKKPLPPGSCVTNCLTCNLTCHNNCAIPRDENKKGCWAMDTNGNCEQCKGKCHWTLHHNNPYIFDYIPVKVEKTYQEKLKKYEQAFGQKLTHETLIEKMANELHQLENCIDGLMQTVNTCNDRLKEIALRPNPLSIVEHIDLMIEAEKSEKKEGYNARITMLQKCRQRNEIGLHVQHFSEEARKTKTLYERLGEKKDDIIGLFEKLMKKI